MPPYARLHYRSAFELEANVSLDSDLWTKVIKQIRSWVGSRISRSSMETNDAFGGSWFYQGGEWAPLAGRGTRVVVNRIRQVEDGLLSTDVPQYWAIRFVHPCRSVAQRWWQTDICVEHVAQNRCRVAFLNYHWIREGYVGADPDPPVPTSPTLVTQLIEMDGVQASHGNVVITSRPKRISDQDMEGFRNALLDPRRDCPVVYCSLDQLTQRPLVDPGILARALAGNAVVRCPLDSAAARGFQNVMPAKLFVNDGMIRVFMPNIPGTINNEESIRHRYFGPITIKENGDSGMVDILAASLARRYSHSQARSILTVDDIQSLNTRAELKQKIREISPGEKPDWVSDLETEMDKLADENLDLSNEINGLRADNENLRDEIRSEKYIRESMAYGSSVSSSTQDNEEFNQVVLKHGISADSLVDVVSVVGRVFSGRVIVCDEAYKSAESAEFNQAAGGISLASKILWAMSVGLYNMLNGVESYSGTIEEAFRSRYGFELAMREGKQTNKDSSIMKSRERTVRGEQVSCVPHVKAQKDGKFLRIHFGVLPDTAGVKRVVIGHCGDHLDTAGTGRRK